VYKRKLLLRIAVCLIPIFAVCIGYAGLEENLVSNSPQPDLAQCAVSPLGWRYCIPAYTEGMDGPAMYSANDSLEIDQIVSVIQLLIGGLGIAMNLSGMCVLALLIGTASAYQRHSQAVTLAITFAASLVCGVLLVLIVIPELLFCAALDVHVLHIIPMIAYAVLLGLFPFALAVFGTKAAEMWSQRRMKRSA